MRQRTLSHDEEVQLLDKNRVGDDGTAMRRSARASPKLEKSLEVHRDTNDAPRVGVYWHLECIGPVSSVCTVEFHIKLRDAVLRRLGKVKEFRVYADAAKLVVPEGRAEFHADWPVSIVDCDNEEAARKCMTVDAMQFANTVSNACVCVMTDGKGGYYLDALISKLKKRKRLVVVVVDICKECALPDTKKLFPLPDDCTSYDISERKVFSKRPAIVTPPPSTSMTQQDCTFECLRDCVKLAQRKTGAAKVLRRFVGDLCGVLYNITDDFDSIVTAAESEGVILVDGKDNEWLTLSTDGDWIDHFANRDSTVRRYASALRRARVTLAKFERSTIAVDLVAAGIPPFPASDIVATVRKHLYSAVGVFWNFRRMKWASTFWMKSYQINLNDTIMRTFGQLTKFHVYTTLPSFPTPLDAFCIPNVCDVAISNLPTKDDAETCMLMDAMLFSVKVSNPFVVILCDGDAETFQPLLSKLKMRRIHGVVIDVNLESRLLPDQRILPLPSDLPAGAGAELAQWAPQCANSFSMWDTFNNVEDLKDCIKEGQAKGGGGPKVLRSVVGALFKLLDTSAENFKKVVRAAVAAGEVECGGDLNEAWIALMSELHDDDSALNDTWSVALRYNPSFTCFDELEGLVCICVDNSALEVTRKDERRGNWRCVSIGPFSTREEAERYSSVYLSAMQVAPKIERTVASRAQSHVSSLECAKSDEIVSENEMLVQ
jgi:hypothetical protein